MSAYELLEGADYVLFGHVYVTNSKAGLPNRGIKGLPEVVQSTSLPVITIGGGVNAFRADRSPLLVEGGM